jgi:hypothetical protein
MSCADGFQVADTGAPVAGPVWAARTDASGKPPLQMPCFPQLSPPRLRVDVVFDGPPMRRKVEKLVMEEIAVIWAAYGVDVHRVKANDSSENGAVRLTVKLADQPDRRVTLGALGSIPFRGGVPGSTITMYPNAIAALVSDAKLNGSNDREWPTAFHELIVGRVLGRALAHEIGHFLLRSRGHSEAGLMRASQSTYDLVAPNRRRFVLTADEVTRLVSTTLQSSPAARPTGTPFP